MEDFMNLFEIISLTYFLGILLGISTIIGFFVIVSKVSAIARDTETIKNQMLFNARQKSKEIL
jgi:hypothetical protein